jgi:signal transduction histidine kinase
MKLINRINHNFISLAVLIIFVGGVVFYIMLRKLMLDQIDNRLLDSKTLIVSNFDDFLDHPDNFVWNEELINVQLQDKITSSSIFLSDTLLQNLKTNNYNAFRKLEFQQHWKDKNYKVKIFKELDFTDNLTLNIMMMLGLLAVFFMMSFFIVFRFVAQSSLIDFFDTLRKARDFNIEEVKELELEESDVDEFEKLNEVLRFMTTKIQMDYKGLKEFTENASHEIQTPLAIIQNKVEQLLQDESLTENQVEKFSDILQATSRLSKLNKGLSQLVRIENGQYIDVEEVDLVSIIENNLHQLEEIIDAKNISVKTNFSSPTKIEININLAELLILNLLKNAVNHNIVGGEINIEVQGKVLIISNSGIDKKLDITNLYGRFTKGSNSKSLGLGLAIVNKICNNYDVVLSYDYKEGLHHIKLEFK